MANLLPQDNYDSFLSVALNDSDTTAYVTDLPTKTAGFLTIFEQDGRTFREKIKYTGIASSPNRLTGLVRGLLGYDTAGAYPDTAGTGLDHPAQVRIAMTDNVDYLGRALAQLNGTEELGGVPQLPAARVIDTARDLVDKEYVDATAGAAGGINPFLVSQNGADPSLTVNIGAGTFISGSNQTAYAGAAAQAVTANQTNYIQLSKAGVLDINIVGFTDGYLPLATVVAGAADISSITDKRPWLTMALTPDQVAALAGTSGTPSGSNKFVTAAHTTATPTDSKIPIADLEGTLNEWVSSFSKTFTAAEDITANDAVALTDDTIVFDAAVAGSASAPTLTINHTVAGKNNSVLVLIWNNNNGGITSVTVAGQAATLITSRSVNATNYLYGYVYSGAVAGVNSVVITRVTDSGALHATVASYAGTLQTSPVDTFASNAAVGANTVSTSITTTAANTRAVGIACGSAASITVKNNCQTILTSAGGNQIRTFDAAIPAAGTYQFNADQGGGAADQGILVFNIKPLTNGTPALVRATSLSPGRAAGFIGFAKAAISAAASGSVITTGLAGGLTVTYNQDYFISSTYGAITTTQSTTNNVSVGRAVSATQIKIEPRRVITYTVIPNGVSVPSTAYIFPFDCGFRPKVVKFLFSSLTATTAYSSVLMEIRNTSILLTYVMTTAPAIVALNYGTSVTLGAATFTITPDSQYGFSLTITSAAATTTSGAIRIIAED